MPRQKNPTSFDLSHCIYLAWYLPIWAEVCRGLNTTPVLPFPRRLSPCCGKELLSAIWHCPLQVPNHVHALESWCCHCVGAQLRTNISCFTRLDRQPLLWCCNRYVTGSVSGRRAHVSGAGLLLGHPRKPCPVPVYATCCAWRVQGRDRDPAANAWRSHESHAQCRELAPHSNRV